MKTRGVRAPTSSLRAIVAFKGCSGQPVPDLVHAPPGLPTSRRMRRGCGQSGWRCAMNCRLVHRRPPHGIPVALLHLAEVMDMRNRCPPSRGIRRMLPPSWDWIGALGADVGEVGDGEDVDDPPTRASPAPRRSLRPMHAAYSAAGAVGAEHVPGAHGALLAVAGAAGCWNSTTTASPLGLLLGAPPVEQLEARSRADARRCVGHRPRRSSPVRAPG